MTFIRKMVASFAAALFFTACAEDPAPAQTPAPVPFSQQQMIDAALNGSTGIIDQALAADYEVDARDSEERTLLMYAAFNGHDAIIKKLVETGADVNAQDNSGSTALMFAASGPNAETVELLLDSGAQINATDSNEHFSALMWAAAEGQAEVVSLLLKRGADPTLKDVDGDTAESFAAQKGHAAVVQLLQEDAQE